jgi:4-diphosphocytidyl-2-C-methyl-D-erythritol kinase
VPADRAISVSVPAKVNLHLSVGELRPDGFHELVTVFQALGLCDEVVARPADTMSLGIAGEGADVLPRDAGNLAWRAAELLADRAGVPAHVHLQLSKCIPVAGGLAGGSADAAATLLACAELWGVTADLPRLAAELGSDVAFLLIGGTALGTGRGEALAPVAAPGTYHWVLAMADFGISAGDAYRELDRQRAACEAPEPAGPPDALLAALAAGDLSGVAAHLVNDLQPAALALAPSLQATLDAGVAGGALAGIVSGSGPTCAFLCPDADAADLLTGALVDAGVCRDARVSTGPARGAHVTDTGRVV